MVPCKITTQEVLFEWSRDHRISLTDSKVRTTLHVFIVLGFHLSHIEI